MNLNIFRFSFAIIRSSKAIMNFYMRLLSILLTLIYNYSFVWVRVAPKTLITRLLTFFVVIIYATISIISQDPIRIEKRRQADSEKIHFHFDTQKLLRRFSPRFFTDFSFHPLYFILFVPISIHPSLVFARFLQGFYIVQTYLIYFSTLLLHYNLHHHN